MGRPHEYSHITQISAAEPEWLPDVMRSEAPGEYIFRCDRCNAFPAMHWPTEIAAYSGMNVHLASVHNAGILSVTGVRQSAQFDMIPIREREPETFDSAPVVEMSSARPLVFSLAMAPAMNDMQVRSAIAELLRLSETPPAGHGQRTPGREADIAARPWQWLTAVMQEAQDLGDHALAAAALMWALHWTSLLVPRFDTASFQELGLYPIPDEWKSRIRALGISATSSLPDDFVVAGDETGQMLAGMLTEYASTILSQ